MSARLRALRAPLTGLVLLAGWLAVGALLTPWQPQSIDWSAGAPSAPTFAHSHWLGTDVLGRDVYARLVDGARVSLSIAIGGALAAVCLGGLVGIVAGLAGGLLDGLLMRIVDACYALPQVFVILLLAVLMGRGPLAVLAGLAATGWLAAARVLRGEAMLLREREFMEAARLMGMGRLRILWRHALPNLALPLAWCLTIAVPQFVLIEGFVSFLGLGVQEPRASLGNLLAEAATHLERAPWLLTGPALVLVVCVLCLHVLTDRLAATRRGDGSAA